MTGNQTLVIRRLLSSACPVKLREHYFAGDIRLLF